MSTSESSSSSSISSDEGDNQDSNLNLFGKKINNYLIMIELGRGAFSIVWMAYNIKKNNFYALKIHHPDDYNDAKEEVKFNYRLPENTLLFNRIIENFTILNDKKKYLCSVYNLYCGDLDGLLRNGNNNDGLEKNFSIKVVYQTLKALDILHSKLKVFHGDLKTDNILLNGINTRDLELITNYKQHELFEKLDDDDNLVKNHKKILDDITEDYENDDIYECSDEVLENPIVSLSDFGNFCDEDDEFNSEFGTRYYRAPEILLVNGCGVKVDIWALGCTFFELLTGTSLFNPKKNKYNTTHQHFNDILNVIGKLPKKLIKKSKVRKKYFTKDYKLRDFKKVDTSLKEILEEYDIMDDEIYDFIRLCLTNNPSQRPSANELLSHNIFSQLI